MSNKDEMLELAFGLIAGAMDDMLDINDTRKMEWRAAALKFRDQYHEMLRLKYSEEESPVKDEPKVMFVVDRHGDKWFEFGQDCWTLGDSVDHARHIHEGNPPDFRYLHWSLDRIEEEFGPITTPLPVVR